MLIKTSNKWKFYQLNIWYIFRMDLHKVMKFILDNNSRCKDKYYYLQLKLLYAAERDRVILALLAWLGWSSAQGPHPHYTQSRQRMGILPESTA